MGDKYRKVLRGEKLQISADVWNTLLDVAEDRGAKRHNQDSESAPLLRNTGLIKIRNQSGAPLNRFAVVTTTAPIITPVSNAAEFKRQVAMNANLPASGAGASFAISLVPLRAGAIGPAVVAGVVPVRLRVDTVLYSCAEPIVGDAAALRSVPHGPARVLWAESSGAERWAIVRLEDSNYEEMVLITSNIPDSQGYYNGVVQRLDLATGNWISQYACKVVDANR